MSFSLSSVQRTAENKSKCRVHKNFSKISVPKVSKILVLQTAAGLKSDETMHR
jgi:hypothetical protein